MFSTLSMVNSTPNLWYIEEGVLAGVPAHDLCQQGALHPLVVLGADRAVVHGGDPLLHLGHGRVLPHRNRRLVEAAGPDEVGRMLRAHPVPADVLGQAEPAQQLHAPAVDVVHLGVAGRRGRLLDENAGDPVPREPQGENRADGPRSHHQHGGAEGFGRSSLVRAQRHPSSVARPWLGGVEARMGGSASAPHHASSGSVAPSCAMTQRVRSTRLDMASLAKTCRRWLSTVWGERNSRAATSRFVIPSATSRTTRSSDCVSALAAGAPPGGHRARLRRTPRLSRRRCARAASNFAPLVRYWASASSSRATASPRWPAASAASAVSSIATALMRGRGLDR